MTPRFRRAFLSLTLLCPAGLFFAAEPDPDTSGKEKVPPIPASTQTLETGEFSPVGMTGSVVGLSVDPQGRVYVSQTKRRNSGAIDIRKNASWIIDSLASRSIEDKERMIKSRMPQWESLAQHKEKIIRLTDADNDGTAESADVLFEGLNHVINGLAGGILWHENKLYITCIPSLYVMEDADGDGTWDPPKELVTGLGIHVGYGGHDMHGPIAGPDGRIYWTIGDKALSVKSREGKHYSFPGHGAMMRIEPDGSGFEVFAHGLRNPQEIVFDDYGNWFNVDNDGDFGDQERLVHILEGSDTGWRMSYQFRSDKKWALTAGYNPWTAESLWKPASDSQPAYLLPTIANFSAGPCGMARDPGTALNERHRGYFFVAESNKQLSAFTVEPNGATFVIKDPHVVSKGLFLTGIDIGPDGALYGADWGDNAWAPHEKGRVVWIDDPASRETPLRRETEALLTAGTGDLTIKDLATQLRHADQRVRLQAQFALVRQGKEGRDTLLAAARDGAGLERIHGLWGLGQLARKDRTITALFLPFLSDKDPAVRAQSAKMIGDAPDAALLLPLVSLLADPEPSVALQSCLALAKMPVAPPLPPVMDLIQANAGKDRALRHGGIMALTALSSETLATLSTHASPEVRLSAVVALRRHLSPLVETFLRDPLPAVVAEAARAIHDDESIPAALPALAKALEEKNSTDEVFLRRAISANLRVGKPEQALRLARFAAQSTKPESMRVEALQALAQWINPPPVDRIQGIARTSLPFPESEAHDALDQTIGTLLADKSPAIVDATTKGISALKYGNALERIEALFANPSSAPTLRASALRAMAALDSPRLALSLDEALEAKDPALRATGLSLLAQTNAKDARLPELLEKAIESDNTEENRSAWQVAGEAAPGIASELLLKGLGQLEKQTATPAIALDIWTAAGKSTDPSVATQVKALAPVLEKRHPLGVYQWALAGGDAHRGEELFRTHIAAQCNGCHNSKPGPAQTGPNLAGIATRRDPGYLLRSLVNPGADIDPAYRIRTLQLKGGEVLTGTVSAETETALTFSPAPGVTRQIDKTTIATSTEQSISLMPPMTALLTPTEIRDLVAWLGQLK